MPQYLIERNIPGAGKLTAAELQGISQKSCAVLNTLGPQIQWVHSYVTDNQIMCVYRAPNEDLLREHAHQGGFPADKISEIKTTIDPQLRNSPGCATAVGRDSFRIVFLMPLTLPAETTRKLQASIERYAAEHLDEAMGDVKAGPPAGRGTG